jgi:hypothetical protein
MIRRLTYFNLIYGIALFAQLGNSISFNGTSSQVTILGVIITIWYNWESLKVIKEQKKRLGKLGLTLGVLTFLFSALLFISNLFRMQRSVNIEDMRWAILLLSILEIIFTITVMIQVIWTVKKYSMDESTSANSQTTEGFERHSR